MPKTTSPAAIGRDGAQYRMQYISSRLNDMYCRGAGGQAKSFSANVYWGGNGMKGVGRLFNTSLDHLAICIEPITICIEPLAICIDGFEANYANRLFFRQFLFLRALIIAWKSLNVAIPCSANWLL